MLTLASINTFYGKIHALKDISLKIGQGEIVTLIGANGAGKTTILKTISGILHPRSGSIVFMEREITKLSPEKIVAMGLCHVPEGRHIFPQLSVLENLEMGAFLRRDKQGIQRDMEYIFSLFPILAQRRKQAGETLSGGEQQMLAISRALMGRPTLLLLDEPSLGLAPLIIRQIFQIIEQINKDGTTVFLIEQNANLALKTAHRGYVIENGEITLADTAENLMCNEDVRKAYLGI